MFMYMSMTLSLTIPSEADELMEVNLYLQEEAVRKWRRKNLHSVQIIPTCSMKRLTFDHPARGEICYSANLSTIAKS